ncbi:phage protein Gp36 family protein [Methylobacterium aquaticum]|uniref:phage protein Gp36 family protein n=1 Tax=Methylobacterium aquaticum TaxID=270351 RepID=UPI003D165B2F
MSAPRAPFVTRPEIQARHPRELAVLAADEKTREIDAVRVDNACADASVEIRGILASRYTPDDLERVDAEGAAVLRLYAIDIALYRVSLSFGRSSETIEKRYAAAVARLRDMAAGKGALTVAPAGGPAAAEGPATSGSPNEVVIDAPERLFTRRRFGGAA